mmetsp:Transcript_11738/g.35773  ORF Transcript_11738/g.35773 Transcript_11738/m.35773 type:complete len:91 (-) Transcript_11738:1227-1499(-)
MRDGDVLRMYSVQDGEALSAQGRMCPSASRNLALEATGAMLCGHRSNTAGITAEALSGGRDGQGGDGQGGDGQRGDGREETLPRGAMQNN